MPLFLSEKAGSTSIHKRMRGALVHLEGLANEADMTEFLSKHVEAVLDLVNEVPPRLSACVEPRLLMPTHLCLACTGGGGLHTAAGGGHGRGRERRYDEQVATNGSQ